MDPNSQNQIWSLWSWRVQTDRDVPYALVRENLARFGRKAFGSASQMNIRQISSTHFKVKEGGSPIWGRRFVWLIKVRTEGHPVQDPAFKTYMKEAWDRFLHAGFGDDSIVSCDVKLEAGSKGDGSPASQLIIVPPVKLNV